MAPFLRRMTDTWGELTPIRKGLLTGAGLIVLAVVFAAYTWSSQTTYVTLYSGLDASDSGAIVEELRAANTPYRLEVNGSTVLVPQSQVNDLRVQFASKGMPAAGHTGFEVFSGNSFTATDFVQRLNFQRGLQGELERTLEAFPAVQRARVHVVMPQKSLFKNDQQPATASVVLALQPGRALQESDVAGMAHLVAGAVEGLDRKHITILNTAGKMIFDGATQGAGGFGTASTQIGAQADFERALAANVQSMLDRTLGPSKAAVNVSATLSFDQVETQTEKFTQPQNGSARSSKTVREAYTTAAGQTPGEIPGAVANVPGANANLPGGTQPAVGAGNGTNYERTETTSNFELDRVLTKQVAAAGGVKRLSVSLLLDESIAEDKVEALQKTVAAAAGINQERGDTIVVTRVPFDRSAIEEANQAFAAEASRDMIFSYVRIALPVLALVAVFVFTRMLMRSLGRRGAGNPAYAGALPEGYGAGAMALPMGAAGMALPDVAANAIRALPPPPLEEVKRSDLEVSVQRMAQTHPETVAEVVQSWLRED